MYVCIFKQQPRLFLEFRTHPVSLPPASSMDIGCLLRQEPSLVHHAYLLNLQPPLVYWKKALFKIISIKSIKTRPENVLPFVTIWMELEGMMLSEIRGKTRQCVTSPIRVTLKRVKLTATEAKWWLSGSGCGKKEKMIGRFKLQPRWTSSGGVQHSEVVAGDTCIIYLKVAKSTGHHTKRNGN